ncbi:MAG: DUF5678 domain-containing protein [Euryarchaeota archaeon]|nr:DUF5678 domain-containing protein [Euryarchaeota archaeon]
MSESYDHFMQMDVSPYIGEWVAICDDEIVGHSHSFKEACSNAKKICGHRKPFIALVPKDATPIL